MRSVCGDDDLEVVGEEAASASPLGPRDRSFSRTRAIVRSGRRRRTCSVRARAAVVCWGGATGSGGFYWYWIRRAAIELLYRYHLIFSYVVARARAPSKTSYKYETNFSGLFASSVCLDPCSNTTSTHGHARHRRRRVCKGARPQQKRRARPESCRRRSLRRRRPPRARNAGRSTSPAR